jgi:hypothetical protein
MQPALSSRLPPSFFALNLAGTALFCVGIVAKFVPAFTQQVPGLADPAVSWALIGVGLLLEAWSMAILLSHLKRVRDAASR